MKKEIAFNTLAKEQILLFLEMKSMKEMKRDEILRFLKDISEEKCKCDNQ